MERVIDATENRRGDAVIPASRRFRELQVRENLACIMKGQEVGERQRKATPSYF